MFLRSHRHLIVSLVKRDLAGRFAGTIFGLFWAVILPLLHAAVYTFVFSVIMRAKTGGEYQNIPFPVWLLAGLLPWTMLSESLYSSAKVISGNANMVKKTIFDKRVLPLTCVAASLVSHCVSLAVLLGIMALFGIYPQWSVIFLPVISLLLVIFSLAWAYILSALNVFIRDIDHVLTALLPIVFFTTPIVYSADLVPDSFRLFLKMSPVYHLVTFYRQTLLLGVTPDPLALFSVSIGVVLFFLFGNYLFRTLSPEFADLL